jgi:hypothetical protein
MKKTHGTKRTKARKSTVKDLSPRKAGQVKAGSPGLEYLKNLTSATAAAANDDRR